MFKPKSIILIVVASLALTAVSALVGGFPLRFLEPVYCIQIVGAVCPPFTILWLPLLIDFAFWTVVVVVGFAGLRLILGAKDKKAEVRENSENERKSSQIQALPKQVPSIKSELLAASKNKLLIIGIAVTTLLVLSTGIASYLLRQNYQFKKQPTTPEPISSPQPTQLPIKSDSTADWETYTNETLSFSIRHPSELTLQKEDWEIVTNGVQKMWWATWRDTNYEINVIIENDPTIRMLAAGVEGSLAEKEEPLTEQNLRNLCAYMETKDLIFQGRPAVRCENRFLNVDKTGGSINYYILDDRRSVRLRGGSFDLDKIDFSFMDQILPTFKFLDQDQTDETVGWETYVNENYGLSVKYPPTWKVRGENVPQLYSEERGLFPVAKGQVRLGNQNSDTDIIEITIFDLADLDHKAEFEQNLDSALSRETVELAGKSFEKLAGVNLHVAPEIFRRLDFWVLKSSNGGIAAKIQVGERLSGISSVREKELRSILSTLKFLD